jgi:starch synthase
VPFDLESGIGNGFKFGPYEPSAFMGAIKRATNLFQDAKGWNRLMANGMASDFSWRRSALKYIELYQLITATP